MFELTVYFKHEMIHPAGTSVISALFEGFYNVVYEKIYFEAYRNDQYI